MSMNIAFVGRRQITVHATGKTETQSKYIDVWQTPTSATYKIEESEDPIAAYCDWVISRSEDEEIKVFEDYDKEVRYEQRITPSKHTMLAKNMSKTSLLKLKVCAMMGMRLRQKYGNGR
jgi:hypothetical protein